MGLEHVEKTQFKNYVCDEYSRREINCKKQTTNISGNDYINRRKNEDSMRSA